MRFLAFLVFIERMSIEEVAEYLQLRKQTAARCRQRAVKKLRASLHDVLGRS